MTKSSSAKGGADRSPPGQCQHEGSSTKYIKYSPPEAQQPSQFTAYTLDDEDMAWLCKQKRNKGPGCSPDELEALVQVLEQAHQQHLAENTRIQQSIKAGNVPDIPPLEEVLSKPAAIKACAHIACAQTVKAVYDYWVQRFRDNKGPLLSHNWFEQPWKARSFRDPHNPSRIGIMPFNEMDDSPSQHRQNVADEKSQARARECKSAQQRKRQRSWQDTAISLGGSRVQPRKLSQEDMVKKLFAHARRVAEAKRNHWRQAHAACVLSKGRKDRAAAVHELEVSVGQHGVLKASIRMNQDNESRKAPWQRRRMQGAALMKK